jgi:hypothetical protein
MTAVIDLLDDVVPCQRDHLSPPSVSIHMELLAEWMEVL